MNPFFLWSRFAWKAGEMAIGAVQVIGHRTHRVAHAGITPSARDQRELALMRQEKNDAAMESARAVGADLLMLNQQFAVLAFKQMLLASASLASIGASRTTAELAHRQAKFVRDTMNNSVVAASKVSGTTAQLARRALAPVHSRVSRNVRRLGKKSK